MSLIADVLLALAALSAVLYCQILSSRLKKFSKLDEGVGAAVASLSSQVDGLKQALERAKTTSEQVDSSVSDKIERAEKVAARLELLIASMHDIESEEAA